MTVTFTELRRNPGKILDAFKRKETVLFSYRGKVIAQILPPELKKPIDIQKHPAFGMWKDREDLKDPAAVVRELRKGRYDDL